MILLTGKGHFLMGQRGKLTIHNELPWVDAPT